MRKMSISLPEELEEKLEIESQKFQGNKSMVIKIALELYLNQFSETAIDSRLTQLETSTARLQDELQQILDQNEKQFSLLRSAISDVTRKLEKDAKQKISTKS